MRNEFLIDLLMEEKGKADSYYKWYRESEDDKAKLEAEIKTLKAKIQVLNEQLYGVKE